MNWPETTKTAQENWIGRSEGTEIEFLILPILSESKIQGQNRGSSISGQIRNLEEIGTNSKETIKVFTTRADTLFGATYLVLAPEHPMVMRLTTYENLDRVNKYLEEARKKSEMDRLHLEKEKTGVFTGSYVVNPINNEKIPVWVADYVIGWYGSGAVMAVPAHDERDYLFAEKYGLKKVRVIDPSSPEEAYENKIGTFSYAMAEGQSFAEHEKKLHQQALELIRGGSIGYSGDGILINSEDFTGFKSADAREEITEKLAVKKLARRKINYRLHDWVISRQRYWGVPIPMVHCAKCGYWPVSDEELPVKLPKLGDYKPTSDGRSPLARAKEWVKTKCPNCGHDAERETDTMDTFVDSSWYFLRYTDPKNKNIFADKAKMKPWLPVDLYIGGAEHNTMHLLYSRFFTKALFDLGLVDFDEPFTARITHGVILGADSQKMSKSRGNVVDPDDLIKKYGADTVRMYLAFMGPYEQGGPWNPGGINGVYRFLNRTWTMAQTLGGKKQPAGTGVKELRTFLNRTIKKIGGDISDLKFNTAVSELMKLLNEFEDSINSGYQLQTTNYELFLKLLSPFAPHLAEEIWQGILGHKKSIYLERWPDYDEKLIAEELVSIIVQVGGKARGVILLPADSGEEEVKKLAFADEKIKKYLVGQEIKRTIFIKNRLINFVI